MRTSGIERVWITPDDVHASDDALAAIAEADLIVLGPGSLFTSLLPSLLIPAIRDAVLAASAPRIYVCNVATQEGETSGFDLAAHVDALVAHTSPGLIDIVLANNRLATGGGPSSGVGEAVQQATDGAAAPMPVRLRWPPSVVPAPRLVLEDVVNVGYAHHHDPANLAVAVIKAFEAEAGLRRHPAGRSASLSA
jgi:hypothetical protein